MLVGLAEADEERAPVVEAGEGLVVAIAVPRLRDTKQVSLQERWCDD